MAPKIEKTMVDKIRTLFSVGITPGLLIALIWKGGVWYSEMKELTFTDIQTKVETEHHTHDLPTQKQLAAWNEHVNSKGVHMSRKAKDSVYMRREEINEIIKNNAIDVYNIRHSQQENQKLNREQFNEIRGTLRILGYKIDKIEKN